MQTVYIGNTLVNDVMLGSQRMDDVFTVPASIQAEYLIVAGGGRGGAGNNNRGGGGAGAGGLFSGSLTILPFITYQIQVGWNDANEIAYPSYVTGSNFYLYTEGGGTGGNGSATATSAVGQPGGSGGGGARDSSGTLMGGGAGIAGQGNNGASAPGGAATGGGGGGATAAGSGITGGAGKASSISGTSVTYSKGGDGGGTSTGGGDGVNFGDGGNGAAGDGNPQRGIGKQGVVILRYRGAQKFVGGTVTTDGDFTIHTFTTTNQTLNAAFTKYTINYS